MKKIKIGMLTKPQGLKGEFRVKHNMEALQVFFNLSQVEINNKMYDVLRVTDRGGFFILKTAQLTDINQVEPLRTSSVYAYVTEEVANEVNNCVGYVVIANNEEIGTINDANNYGSVDVYTLSDGRSFPCVPNLVESVDVIDNYKNTGRQAVIFHLVRENIEEAWSNSQESVRTAYITFRVKINDDASFGIVNNDIYITAKYSLQGTTQGRYLTGGVPPVRFSM